MYFDITDGKKEPLKDASGHVTLQFCSDPVIFFRVFPARAFSGSPTGVAEAQCSEAPILLGDLVHSRHSGHTC